MLADCLLKVVQIDWGHGKAKLCEAWQWSGFLSKYSHRKDTGSAVIKGEVQVVQ